MNKRISFSQWLDAELKEAGLSGKDLAVKVGVSEATISRIRNGRMQLSPRMKARLSLALNAQVKDVPNVEAPLRGSNAQINTQAKTPIKLSVVQHAIPDHATANYALAQGLFLRNDILANEISDRESGVDYPHSYINAIKDQVGRGQNVLAAGPKLEFERNGLMPCASIFSHTYRGYHLITRATTAVPSVEDAPLHQRFFTLKLLLEQLENSEIWSDNFSRISWQSSIDLKFLRALRGLSCDLTGIDPHADEAPSKVRNKAGLDYLHAFGKQGVDFVMTDAGTLAEAYSHPEYYKVLLSLDKVEKIIRSLSTDVPPAVLANLKKVYRSDKASVAIERFQTRWLEALSQVEVPVYWNLFCRPGVDPLEQEQLIDGVTGALQDLQQALASPQNRRSAISSIKSYCEARAYKATGKANPENFQLVWDCCYQGL